MALIKALPELLERPANTMEYTGLMVFLCPIWMVFLLVVGVVIGWSWKPKWAPFGNGKDKFGCSVSKGFDFCLPSSPSRSLMSPLKGFSSAPCLNSFELASQGCEALFMDRGFERTTSASPSEFDEGSTSQLNEEKSNVVTEEDLDLLCTLVDMKDGGPTWIRMMERSTPTMNYQGWCRDPEIGPPQYRTRTVYEDATPEIVRDFFWDDEFRLRWDDMLRHSTTIEECPTTGTMVVQWIRKFPLFCKDREYIIGRRIWESGRLYYCVTKGVPYASIPRHDKRRRVDLCYSSWCIQAVESRRANGQLTACEVLFFHHEDTGIPWDIAKLGIRKAMWGTVKKIEAGLRAYQTERALGLPLSRSAFMAQINTKIHPEYLKASGDTEDSSQTEVVTASGKAVRRHIPKLIIFGGTIILACILNRELLMKTLVFGVTRRFAKVGKKL
ncbi:unnamed protein product [Prunus brigantina]